MRAGLVEDHRVVGPVMAYPPDEDADSLPFLSPDDMIRVLCDAVSHLSEDSLIGGVGIGFPGLIRGGVVEESPNLEQFKGVALERAVLDTLQQRGLRTPVTLMNDAQALAAGIAAAHGELDKQVRVWWLGNGVGLGRYPAPEGPSEGGHMVVTLDPKERYCGCGGVGHLEGIMGHRAMRLRFLDLEPEEVFEQAARGVARCAEFADYWHRALAAATASSIHLSGVNKFYISGPNARFVQMDLLRRHLQDMVAMTPLQAYVIELLPDTGDLALIGAAVNAEQAPSSVSGHSA